MSDLTPFTDLKIGVNPVSLHNLITSWKQGASDADLLAARDLGVHHWPALAASADFGGHGVLALTTERKSAKEDRTYTVAPFPVGSIPKPLRPAFTSPFPGEVLIDLDWRASHWQLLAFRSGDLNLVADLRAGDLYTAQFPGPWNRDQAKAACNTVLNGGGVESLTGTLGNEADARAFLDRVHELLRTRWAKAGAFLRDLRAEAVKHGWVTPDREWAGAGIALMRMEAENLRQVCAHPKLVAAGMRPVLPLHDGVLVSAPAASAQKIAAGMARLMVMLSTGSQDEAANHTATWAKWSVSRSWTGDVEPCVGQDLRAAALRACSAKDPAELALAAAAMPADLEAAMRAHHPASAEYRAARAALAAHQAAVQWVAASRGRRAAATPEQEVPTVDLPHGVASYANISRIVRGDEALPRLAWNARESCITVGGREADDTTLRRTYLTALEDRYGMLRASEGTVMAAVLDVAREHEFDPVRDYFDGLTWDGVSRLSTWLHDYAGAVDLADTPEGSGLVRVYGEKWMMSIVARAYEPGCKVDTMLVLMGGQGARKSSMLRAIAPAASFAAVQIDPSDKDSVLRASKFAVVEWPELAGASKREQEVLKDYFSLQEDRVRPPYARGDLRIPRRTVFAATTNEDDFLRDATGSRRYWPVRVGQIDLDGLLAIKDQLWAEAVDLYRFLSANGRDHRWWLTPEQDAERTRQAEHFTASDPIQAKVWDCVVQNSGRVTLDAVLDHLDCKPSERARLASQVTASLRRLGCTSKVVKEGGRAVRRWVHPGPFAGPGHAGAGLDLEVFN